MCTPSHSAASGCLWPVDCSLPGPSVHRMLQAKLLEQVAISYSRESSPPKNRNCISRVSCTGRQILCHCAPWEAQAATYQRSCWERFQSWPVSPALATLLCFPLQMLMSSLQLKEYALSINSCKHKARDCDAKLTKYAPCFQGVQNGVRKIKIILKLLYCDDIRH